MKKMKIFNIAAGIALAMGATACSSDYLDLEPEGTLKYDQVVDNEAGATLAVHSLCGSMYTQYSALYDYNWFNGEPWLGTFYGDVMGQDYISLMWFLSNPEVVNWSMMDNWNSFCSQVAWSYCYGLISQANNIIYFAPKKMNEDGTVQKDDNGNDIPDISGVYAFRYAQALAIRAHAYTRLMQIYAPRWPERFDKNNPGEEVGTVPLRLKFEDPEGNTDCPLSTMSVVMDQIYADLYQAIDLFKSSGTHRAYAWEPDIQIAQGLLARAAMLREDWKLAKEMAKAARAGYDIMTIDEYYAGFAEPNSEWMWTNSGMAQGVYYASFGASYACNGSYPCLWGNIGAGAVDIELFKLADSGDRRKALYYLPSNRLEQKIQRGFWNENCCNSITLNINDTDEKNFLHDDFVTFCGIRYNTVKENGWYPPYTYQGAPLGTNKNQTGVVAQFGAQFKFWGTDGYATSYYPFMRASEMLLIEAEAAYHDNDDEATALACLNELNRQRFNNYRDKNYSGEQLLEKIKVCRRIELWGEGFNWFDFKRWNEDIVRKPWEPKTDQDWRVDPTEPGNWPASVAGTHPVNESRGWRYRIPSIEFNYNHAISASEATASDD